MPIKVPADEKLHLLGMMRAFHQDFADSHPVSIGQPPNLGGIVIGDKKVPAKAPRQREKLAVVNI